MPPPSSGYAEARGADGEVIEYAFVSLTIGLALIAWTRRGVCEVALGEARGPLLTELSSHFPKARVEAAPLNAWVKAVVRTVAGTESAEAASIPLDVRGTAFQERVWQRLRAIPSGQTHTYAQIARALGQPRAARAVAGACAANRVAVLVPCHRAVGQGGRLAGYRWGIERKRALLDRECCGPSA